MLGNLFKRARQSAPERPMPDFHSDRCPPVPRGVPFYDVDGLLEVQNDIIHQIKDLCDANDERFETYYRNLMRNYASFVHALPASEYNHHRETCGLLRHGLEVGHYSLLYAQAQTFVSIRVDQAERRIKEPRWRYACFVAGLCHDLGKVVGDIEVVDSMGNTTWNPYQESLMQWGDRLSLHTYHPSFRKARIHGSHGFMATSVIQRVVGEDQMAYIAEGGKEIVEAMMLAIVGKATDEENLIAKLVARADRDSTEDNLKQSATVVKGMQVSHSPVEKFVSTLRRLVSEHWKVNVGGAKLYVTENGVYLKWPDAMNEVRARLNRDGGSGLPADPNLFADQMIREGFAEEYITEDGEKRNLWKIAPKIKGTPTTVTMNALRFSRPDIIWGRMMPKAIGVDMLEDAREASHTSDSDADTDDASTQMRVGGQLIDSSTGEIIEEASESDSSEPVADDKSQKNVQKSYRALQKSGAVGEMCISIADEIAKGMLENGIDWWVQDEELYLNLRKASELIGFEAKELGDMLFADRLLVKDNTKPLATTWKVQSPTGKTIHAARFIKSTTEAMLNVARIDPNAPTPKPKKEEQKKAEPEKPTPEEPKQQTTKETPEPDTQTAPPPEETQAQTEKPAEAKKAKQKKPQKQDKTTTLRDDLRQILAEALRTQTADFKYAIKDDVVYLDCSGAAEWLCAQSVGLMPANTRRALRSSGKPVDERKVVELGFGAKDPVYEYDDLLAQAEEA